MLCKELMTAPGCATSSGGNRYHPAVDPKSVTYEDVLAAEGEGYQPTFILNMDKE